MVDTSLEDRYDGFFRKRTKLSLREENVPMQLRPFVEWAAYWGIADDIDRESLIDAAPKQAINDLREIVDQMQVELNEWLAGPEAEESPPSDEYVAFSAMRLATL